MSRGNHLNRLAFLAEILWKGEARECILYITQEPRMNSTIWLFQTNNRWWSWQVRKYEHCHCEKRALGEFPRGNGMRSNLCSKSEASGARLGCFE